MITIRKYKENDLPELKLLSGELHEELRQFDKRLAPTEEIIEPYFKYLLDRISSTEGTFFIAEADGQIMGHLCFFGRVDPLEPDVYPGQNSFIAELYVKPAYRRQKIADRLLKEAETYTRSLGINRIEMAVLHENVNAHAVFQAKGYRESVHILSKEL